MRRVACKDHMFKVQESWNAVLSIKHSNKDIDNSLLDIDNKIKDENVILISIEEANIYIENERDV